MHAEAGAVARRHGIDETAQAPLVPAGYREVVPLDQVQDPAAGDDIDPGQRRDAVGPQAGGIDHEAARVAPALAAPRRRRHRLGAPGAPRDAGQPGHAHGRQYLPAELRSPPRPGPRGAFRVEDPRAWRMEGRTGADLRFEASQFHAVDKPELLDPVGRLARSFSRYGTSSGVAATISLPHSW